MNGDRFDARAAQETDERVVLSQLTRRWREVRTFLESEGS